MDTTAPRKKLTSRQVIQWLLYSVNQDDKEMFYKYIQLYIDCGQANDAIKTLFNKRIRTMQPLAGLSSDIKKLILPVVDFNENVFLNETLKTIIDELLVEWKHTETFSSHNLEVRNKLLLYGPTGNGKTTIAKHIAKIADLPFVQVNTDAIIDSHIGTTGKFINTIFSSIKEPCILFWDEIDSIGSKRLDAKNAADQESDRAVNSLLVNMERMDKKIIFIAATNRKDNLDTAFLRRFNIMLDVPAPSPVQRVNYATQLAEFYKLPEELPYGEITKLDSYSAIKEYMINFARKQVLNNILKNEPGRPS